jgi:hypothetical protein
MKSKKYSIEYCMIGGMNIDLISQFINEINSIYLNIKSLYSHGDNVVLSGSCAILYYLYLIGYNDLINELLEPNDIDFLLLTNETNSVITVPFIGDYKRQQDTHEKSATFKNDWDPHLKFKSFDLTIPRNSITFNQFDKINLISLKQLKSYYNDDLDERPLDNKKIKIIEQIQDRLLKNPRPDIIQPEQVFKIGKNNLTKIPIHYDEINIKRSLFVDDDDDDHDNIPSPSPPQNKNINRSLFADDDDDEPDNIPSPSSPNKNINRSLFADDDDDEPVSNNVSRNLFID